MVVIDCWPMPMTSTISGVREKMTDTQTRNKYQTLETNTPAGVIRVKARREEFWKSVESLHTEWGIPWICREELCTVHTQWKNTFTHDE